jgi:hypothetical protein
MGIRNLNEDPDLGGAGFRNAATADLVGTIDTGDGNDIIIGIAKRGGGIAVTFGSTINTGDGNDTITGTATHFAIKTDNLGTIDTGNGNDIITGIASYSFINFGTINTGDGEDSIISQGTLINYGGVFLGDGNDLITAHKDLSYQALENFNPIETGDGNDIITSTGVIYNEGVINTGNSDDSIIVDGGVDSGANEYDIDNNGVQLIWVMVTTLSLLMKAFCQD